LDSFGVNTEQYAAESNMTESTRPAVRTRPSQKLTELALLFLRLGATAFGRLAAHIAMLYDEVVDRRRWLSEQEFLNLVCATNLIPGPNSTEMAIHVGFLRVGGAGLLVAGVSFILPAMTIVLVLAWAYMHYGSTVEAGWLLYGVKPVVIAIIAKALWDLGRKALQDAFTITVGVAVFTLYFLGINEVALLVLGELLVLVARNIHNMKPADLKGITPFFPGILPTFVATPFSLGLLCTSFLKIGAVLYGSGYVLLAFLRSDFVLRLGWLTDAQLVDAVAVGQLTPGPVFTTATFVGFLLGGTVAVW
jgi:chromate transporter